MYLVDFDRAMAYVRIREFVNDTGGQLKKTLQQLTDLRGLVLDLRDNPGGNLSVAVEAANLFLREGVIVTSVNRSGDIKKYVAQSDWALPEIPMVVLIDGETASAAEILAAALKVHRRAVLVGMRSRGKGRVQSMFPLPGGLGQINLTTSELLIPSRQSISREPDSDVWGVDPHPRQKVEIAPEHLEKLQLLQGRSGTFQSMGAGAPATVPAIASRRARVLYREFVRLDSQFARAMELLIHPEEMEEILKSTSPRAETKAPTTQCIRESDE
jgi:C-terminal processing protease CtpA/Prc